MKFRMTCPKCGSTNFSIERDNRSYAPRDQTFEMIFSCRCGKQMFGDQIVKEFDRQKAEFESQVRAEAAERGEEPRPEPRVEPAAAEATAPPATADAAPPEPAVHDDDDEPGDEIDEHDDGVTCGWHPCKNPRRPNSKYCSRDCSNKNARWRYKQRKNTEKEAA